MSKKLQVGIALLMTAQLGWLAALQYSDWQRSQSAELLADKLAGVPEDLHALQLKHAEHLAAFNDATGRLEQLEAQSSSLFEQVAAIRASQADILELRVVLAAQIQQLSDDVSALKKQSTAKPSSPAPRPASQPRPRPSSSRVAKSSPPTPPPFVLLGIETRAGEPFASVAANDAARLEDVQLLRAGEAFKSWRLIRVDGQAAVFFAPEGRERVVSLR